MANEDEREERELDVEHPGSEGGAEEESVLELHEPIAREKDEPRDGFEPLPTWLVFVFFGLLGWGGWYLGRYGAEFRPDIFRIEETSIGAAIRPVEPPGPRDPGEVGAAVYQRTCTPCHQASGEGLAGSFPPLTGAEYVLGDPSTLARIVLHGLEGEITVRGETYTGVMPGWGRQLDDFEIAAVLTHIRSHFGNDAPPVPEELVRAVREESAGRSARWRAAELEQAEPVEIPESEPPPEEGEAVDATDEGEAVDAPDEGEAVDAPDEGSIP